MSFPAPTERQARILWFCLTTLAVAVCVVLVGLAGWGLSWLVQRLSPVLLPLMVAAILACLLAPLVDFFEQRIAQSSGDTPRPGGAHRARAILAVFGLSLGLLAGVAMLAITSIVPELTKAGESVQRMLDYQTLERTVQGLQERHRDQWLGRQVEALWRDHQDTVQEWGVQAVQRLSQWSFAQLSKAVSWFSFLVGLALVPVYAFYFLLEARTIERQWSDYLPLMESRFKEEVVFVLRSFNDCLVVFFRGQVLVAFCVGACLAVGFTVIGLPFGLLLGVVAGLVGLIPYFGVIITAVPVVLLSVFYHDQMLITSTWGAPLLALGICALVLLLEKLVIQPKIIGDRVGMHPAAVIVAVLFGTYLVGGVIGGLLAIPIAMALRTVLVRYIWMRTSGAAAAG
ncbi:MAG: AI-2E family transporter [Pedosphaera sp.]|nr:AI-2E family transporter [Pedosphaera sp.]